MALTDGMTPEEIANTDARYGLHVRPETAEWLVAFAAGFKGSKSDRAAFAAVAEAVRASFGDKTEADESGRKIHAAYLPLFDAEGVSCDSHMNRVMDVLGKRSGRSKADKEAIMELRTELAGASADMYTCPREPEIVPAPVVVAVPDAPAPVETPAPVVAEVPAAPVKAKRVRKAKGSAPVETPDAPAPVVADGPSDETRAEYTRLVLITEASQRMVDRARAAGVGSKGVQALADRVSADNLSAQEIDELANELYPVETPDADTVATPDADAFVAAPVPVPVVESAPVADVAPGDAVAAIAVKVGAILNKWSDVTRNIARMTMAERKRAAQELTGDFAECAALQADADGKGTPLGKLDADANTVMYAARKILRNAFALLGGSPQYRGDKLTKTQRRTFRKAVAPWRADATAALPVV